MQWWKVGGEAQRRGAAVEQRILQWSAVDGGVIDVDGGRWRDRRRSQTCCCLLLAAPKGGKSGNWKVENQKGKKPKTISKFHVFYFYFLIKKIN